MDVNVSKSSFGQSAKILAKTLEAKYGPLGQGGLSWSRGALAQALKFGSVHEIEQFFEKPMVAESPRGATKKDAKKVEKSEEYGFGNLPEDERSHAIHAIRLAQNNESSDIEEEYTKLFVDSALKATPALPVDTYLARIEAAASRKNKLSGAQYEYTSMRIARTIELARRLEAFGGTLIAPAFIINGIGEWTNSSNETYDDFNSRYAVNLDGTWLLDRRFVRVIRSTVSRRQSGREGKKAMHAWDFFMSALRFPMQSERVDSIQALLSVAGMPKSHLLDIQQTILKAEDVLVAAAQLKEAKS